MQVAHNLVCPVAGVDWAGSTDDPITVGESTEPVDIGTIELEPYAEPDGGV